jgi:hypothetical protein
MSATKTVASGNKISAPGRRSRGHDGRQSYQHLVRVDDPHGLRLPAGCDAQRVPSTTVTPDPYGQRLSRPGVTRPLAFFVGRGADANEFLDVGEPGFIRRPRVPDHAGSNPAIQTDGRKGKPTGDGTRPEPGRATSLEGSTPSPSAASEVPVAERPRRRSSKPDRRVRLPPGTLTDGSLTRRRTTGPVGNRQTTLFEKEGCWGFNSPLGH